MLKTWVLTGLAYLQPASEKSCVEQMNNKNKGESSEEPHLKLSSGLLDNHTHTWIYEQHTHTQSTVGLSVAQWEALGWSLHSMADFFFNSVFITQQVFLLKHHQHILLCVCIKYNF